MSFNAIVERDIAATRLLCSIGFPDAEGVRKDLILSTDESIYYLSCLGYKG